jgi:L-ribulose-5-phosphate 4-epimerase
VFTPTPDLLLPELPLEVQMVVLARTLWAEGYDDHLAGHITVRLDDGTLMCNPWLLPWDEFGPDDVIRIDLDGNVAAGDWPVPLGIPLHLELHKARHGVGVALHHHPRWGTVWADAGRLPAVYDQSSALGGGEVVLVDEYRGAVNDSGSAAAAVKAMGDADIALLANHGVFVLGNSIRAVHQRAVALEHRCRVAWHTEAIGGGQPLVDEVAQVFRASDGEGFLGFWEADARRALRRAPPLLDGTRPPR